MAAASTHLFLPGWGAMASAYAPGLPSAWSALEPPGSVRRGATVATYLEWLGTDLSMRPEPSILGGHSMGGAIATLAAALWPDRVAGLVLVSPAGLPLTKPLHRSALQFVGQATSRRFSARETLRSIAALALAPASALRLALAVRALDISDEMRAVAASQIPVTVIGCRSDTLVTPVHCRHAAGLLGAHYRELPLEGGHMWMFGHWRRFEHELTNATARHRRYEPAPRAVGRGFVRPRAGALS